MNNLEERKTRYLKDDLPIRLGGLAANLARVSSFIKNFSNKEVVNGLLEESKHFIEWTAKETKLDTTVELINLQITLARWQLNWSDIWNDENKRLQVGQQAKELSSKVLAHSGLLNAN